MSYKWLLSLYTIVFSTTNLFSMNQLEARPVLFLNTSIFYQEDETGEHKVNELKNALKKRNEFIKWHQEEIKKASEKFNVHTAQNEIEKNERQKAYSAVIELMDKLQTESQREFSRIRDRISKRAQELSTKYAKQFGACAVIDYRQTSYCGQLYVDPAYEITDRIIEELNKEYSR